jgi:hypothetical protein
MCGYLIVVGVLAIYAGDCYAYFDPGTGSLLVQILVGLVAGVSFFFHSIRQKLKSIFSSIKSFLWRK